MNWSDFVEAAKIRLNESEHWKDVFFEQTSTPIEYLNEFEAKGVAPYYLWRKLRILSTAIDAEGSALWIAKRMKNVEENISQHLVNQKLAKKR